MMITSWVPISPSPALDDTSRRASSVRRTALAKDSTSRECTTDASSGRYPAPCRSTALFSSSTPTRAGTVRLNRKVSEAKRTAAA